MVMSADAGGFIRQPALGAFALLTLIGSREI
jgi:hypothetical protein